MTQTNNSTIDRSTMEAAIKKQESVKNEKVREESSKVAHEEVAQTAPQSNFRRKITVIGVGDCGSNIASETHKQSNGKIATVIYNTSARSSDNLSYDKAVFVAGEDGSGKDREYSKNIFKNGTYEQVHKALDAHPADYLFVSHSLDGGTAGAAGNVALYSGANIAKTIMLGVIPTLASDQKSQHNGLQWREEMHKIMDHNTSMKDKSSRPTILGYMLFDNNRYSGMSESDIFESVNVEAANALQVIEGSYYVGSDGRSLDNRNLFKLLSHRGRINVYTSTRKIKMDEEINDYIIDMIGKSAQPAPLNPTAYCLMVKGPEDFIKSIDFNMSTIQSQYGEAVELYKHVEKSETEFRISLITSGSVEPFDRFKKMKIRYDEINESRKNLQSTTGNLSVDDPFNKASEGFQKSETVDKSGLDI